MSKLKISRHVPRDTCRLLAANATLWQVGLELAPLIKAQPTGNPRKDSSTGYMMDAKLTRYRTLDRRTGLW